MEQGSPERAMEGRYELSVSEVIGEAWRQTEGVKGVFVGAFAVYMLVGIILYRIIGIFFNLPDYDTLILGPDFILLQIGADLLGMPVEVPMLAALLMMGVRRVNGIAPEIGDLFRYYVLVWPLFGLAALVYLLVTAGLFLLVLPGLYLSVAYIFVFPLMIDRGMGIWEAMEASRRAVTHRWFTVFGILLAMALLTALSAVPLGIGLIWTLPMCYLAYGVMYTRVFGFAAGSEQERFPVEEDQ